MWVKQIVKSRFYNFFDMLATLLCPGRIIFYVQVTSNTFVVYAEVRRDKTSLVHTLTTIDRVRST